MESSSHVRIILYLMRQVTELISQEGTVMNCECKYCVMKHMSGSSLMQFQTDFSKK